MPTVSLLKLLISKHPDVWGAEGPLGKSLTAHRFGWMLAQSYLVNSTRPKSEGPRGYTAAGLSRAWGRMNLPLPKQPAEVAQVAQAAQSRPVQPVQPLRPLRPEGAGAHADPELPHHCSRCQIPIRHRGGMCPPCSLAGIRAAQEEIRE